MVKDWTENTELWTGSAWRTELNEMFEEFGSPREHMVLKRLMLLKLSMKRAVHRGGYVLETLKRPKSLMVFSMLPTMLLNLYS